MAGPYLSWPCSMANCQLFLSMLYGTMQVHYVWSWGWGVVGRLPGKWSSDRDGNGSGCVLGGTLGACRVSGSSLLLTGTRGEDEEGGVLEGGAGLEWVGV